MAAGGRQGSVDTANGIGGRNALQAPQATVVHTAPQEARNLTATSLSACGPGPHSTPLRLSNFGPGLLGLPQAPHLPNE